MRELLQRPTIEAGEWWNGYVARTLAENGHTTTCDYMLRKLMPMVAQLVSKDYMARALAGDPNGVSLCMYSRWTMPSWAVRGLSSAAAHCPSCFAEGPYIRLSWRLRAVTHCDVHGQPLRTRCATCHRLVFHWDLARGRCRCGNAFGQSVEAAEEHECRQIAPCRMGLGARRLFSVDGVQEASASIGDTADVPESLAVVVFLGGLIPALSKGHTLADASACAAMGALFMSSGLAMSPSFDGVGRLLRTLSSAAHLRAALTFVLSLMFAERSAISDWGTRLPLQAWSELLCAHGASPEGAERRGLVQPGALRRRLLPLKVAARRAGIGEMHLHLLMSRGEIIPIRTLEVGERQHLFSEEQVQRLSEFRHQGYGYGMALDVGLETSRLKVLRLAGIVGEVKGNDGRTWLDGNELRALLSALAGRATEVDAVAGQMLCLSSERIWQSRHVSVLKMLFQRLLAGDIALWAFGAKPGLARFYVGVDALELLHRGALAGDPGPHDQGLQCPLSLVGGVSAWMPTATPWQRLPLLGAPRRPRGQALQLALDF